LQRAPVRGLCFYWHFIRRRGGGGAYIDRTVDKMSFVIFVIRSVGSLSVDRQNHARLDVEAIGIALRAIVRVNLQSHAEEDAKDFLRLIEQHQEVAEAFSVSGDADYVLILQYENLRTFADLIHTKLLPQKVTSQVRSEIVLNEIKRSY
jgi:hypothetical protein